jgi:uncharacterized protein with FMN-binding domain
MKNAPWFVFAGTVAGLVGILSFHTKPATSVALPGAGSAGHASHTTTQTGGNGHQAAPAGVRTATGTVEQYGYGELAVKITVNGSKIINVTVPYIQTAEQYSQQLAAQIIPTLRSEVLSGQTANINGVSGASYTSRAYAMSVQAALDKLNVK